MQDSGDVLPGLDEPWTFMGANAMEWAVGLVVFLLIGSMSRTPASAMPLMMVGWLLTTSTLASTRRLYPDEQRGVRNAVMSACGFPPPGIPLRHRSNRYGQLPRSKSSKRTADFKNSGSMHSFPVL